MTASSVPMPHIPTAFHGGQDLVKPASHEGRIEEGDGGGTVRGGNSQRPREKGTRTVRTVPPFAAFDPPSPVLSPRLGPVDAPRDSTQTQTMSPQLSLTLSNNNNNSAPVGEYDDEQGPQASWWTFAKPGRWKQVQNLHNAWHEQMMANQELRMESEHRGRDYFAPKRGSTIEHEGESQQTGEPQHVRPPFGMSSTGMNSHMGSYFHLPKLRRRSASTEDIRGNPLPRGDDTSRRSSVHGAPPANQQDSNGSGGPSSAAATPARVETPGGGPRTRRARFKAMSLPPISRRPSVDEHQPPFSTAGVGNGARVDGFVLGPPIEGIEEVSVGAAAGSTRESSTPPPPPRESPHMLNIQIPGPSVPANSVSSPRRAHHPQLSIALPPPTFAPPPGTKAAARTHDAPITTTTDMPPPMFQQRLYQAQAPPTPLGWDAPWRERDQGMFGRPRGAKAHQHSHHHHHLGQRDSGFAVEDPWLQPFEETAFEDTSEASREESPRSPCVGRTRRQRGAVGSDSSGPLFTLSEKSRGRRQTSGRGRTERALTKWAALRRSAVKNPPGTRRTKIREYLMYDARSTLYLRLLTLVGIATSLGIGCKLFLLEQESDLDGILGSAPILSISYGSVSSIHCLLIMYREAFGKPIGLWGLRSKMTWVCLDLFFIALWSSDLSLTISDYMSSPLQCAKNPWWTSNDYIIPLPEVITRSSQKDDMCNRQAALIAFVLVTLIMYVLNIIISLFRIFERLSTVAKSYEQSRVGQLV